MKTLNNQLIVIPVPMDAEDFSFEDKATIRFKVLGMTEYLGVWEGGLDNYQILGTITKSECSFDCTIYVDDFIDSPQYSDYFNAFKSMIESETGYIFENELPKPSPLEAYPLTYPYTKAIDNWQRIENGVVDKLLIIEPIK